MKEWQKSNDNRTLWRQFDDGIMDFAGLADQNPATGIDQGSGCPAANARIPTDVKWGSCQMRNSTPFPLTMHNDPRRYGFSETISENLPFLTD